MLCCDEKFAFQFVLCSVRLYPKQLRNVLD